MLSYSSELTRALPDIQFSSESFEAKVLLVYLFGGVMNAAFLIEGKWRFMTARTIGYLLLRRYFHRSPKEARMLSHELLMAAIRPRSSLQ